MGKDATSEQHLRVAVETISLMMSKNRVLSETHLFRPLTQPLALLTKGTLYIAIEL